MIGLQPSRAGISQPLSVWHRSISVDVLTPHVKKGETVFSVMFCSSSQSVWGYKDRGTRQSFLSLSFTFSHFLSLCLFRTICIRFLDTNQASTMRFTILVAFTLPLSALAAPAVPRPSSKVTGFFQMKNGVSDALSAITKVLSMTSNNERSLCDALSDTSSPPAALQSRQGVNSASDAASDGQDPPAEEYVDTPHQSQ